MTMLAEVVDAVIGGDTHRDTHALEMLAPNGATIAHAGDRQRRRWLRRRDRLDRRACARARGSSSGLRARAATASGWPARCGRPGWSSSRSSIRGAADRRRGKSDPIDAHLAALQVLRMTAERLPTPRADGDREALRILLGARREMTVTKTKQINRLRALLLGGDDTDRDLSRGALTDTRLQAIARRRGRAVDTTEQAVRRGEARRLAIAIRAAMQRTADNKRQLAALVGTARAGAAGQAGVGPVSAAQAIVSWSHHGRCRSDAAFAALAGSQPDPGQQRPHRAPPPQPRRRPATQPSPARHHPDPLASRPPHPRLHRPTTRRRQERHRDPPRPQTLRRPRTLPRSRSNYRRPHRPLDNT